MGSSIYLDYAAATPLDDEIAQLMQPYWSERFFNPSANYLAGRQLKQELHLARARVAHWLGCKPAEVVFTAGVTESINLAIQGIMKRYPKGTVLAGATEHQAVLEPVRRFSHRLIPVMNNGTVNTTKLAEIISGEVVLISLMYANNETGAIHPLREVAALITNERQRRTNEGIDTPLYFHCDAAQAGNYLDLHVSRLGVDLLSISGAKIYGPKMSGALYVRAGLELEPVIVGGGQERGLRGGTENAALIMGLAAALDTAQQRRQAATERAALLRDELQSRLRAAIEPVEINAYGAKRLPNILSITIAGIDGDRFVQELDEQGIMAATGAACSAADSGPSHVLLAMGLDPQAANASLRLSCGRQTTTKEIKQAAQTISRIIQT